MSSSLANYTSGLINTLAWVLSTHEVEDAQGISTGDQLINLRSQLEAQARIDRMYRKRSPNFISWEDVQKTRLAVAKAYAAVPPTADRAVKRKALLDLLVVLFHSITPPDRVGVIRRLKFGVTLVKEKPGEWAIDLTKFRHKTSR